MRDRLAGRVSRIISGSIHSLIDAVENVAPESVMEQAIREIEEAAEEVRSELGQVVANKHLANSRLTQINTKWEELGKQAELAVTEGRDDLAEVAIGQQLDMEAQIPIIETQISDLGKEEKELESYLTALKGKKGEMREELRIFRESRKEQNGADSSGAAGKSTGVEGKVDRAQSAFERTLERSTGLPAGSSSADAKSARAMAELEELAKKNRIQERLAAVKGQKRTE